jgi:hypothetical protein
MARANGPVHVYCYHCGRRIEIGSRTMSTSCPGCHKSVLIEDIVVKGYTGVTNLETCGRLIVNRRGHAVAKNRIVAHAGIEVKGRVQCGHALTAGRAVLSGKAEWRGDLHAVSLVVEQGAVIVGGRFRVPDDPLEPHRHQEQVERVSPQ